MYTLIVILLAITHIVFLLKVWSEVGFLWMVGCLIIPLLCLFVVYKEWEVFKGIFLFELALTVAYFFVV